MFIFCEPRLYAAGQDLENKVVHGHGRFCVDTLGSSLQLEFHRFDIMDVADPEDDRTPNTIHTSVTLFGRVVPTEGVEGVLDKYFALETSEYVRDCVQTFSIRFVNQVPLTHLLISLSRCRLNKTSSKRWEKTTAPVVGTMVLVSGSLGGENPEDLFVEVETMRFVSTGRGAEGTVSPGKSKFGIPNGSVF